MGILSRIFGDTRLLQDKEIYSQIFEAVAAARTTITPPEDELLQKLRKFVNKSPCLEEAFYLQLYYNLSLSVKLNEKMELTQAECISINSCG